MTAVDLVQARRSAWRRLDDLLDSIGGQRKLDGDDTIELAELYRSACADAARARSSGADPSTIAYLDQLLARTHNRLYGSPRLGRADVAGFVARTFPQTVRRNLAFFAWATLAFYGPFVFGALAAIVLPDFASSVMGPAQAEMFRRMYESMPDAGRSAAEGGMSVSFYIQHNTSIGFRVFATGIFLGLGSAFMLVYQGLVIGTTIGFLIADDKARHILTFVCSHSAWELTAIVLAGAAGLRMGWALVDTGGRTRLGSLRHVGPDVVRLVAGAAIFFFVAACIEGLWSASSMPAPVKWSFAAVQIAIVSAYLALAGRGRRTA